MFSIVWTWSSLEKAIDRSLFHSTKKVWQIWRNRKLSRLCWLGRATWVIQRTPKSSFKVEQTYALNFCMRMLSSIFVRQGRVEFHPSTSTGQLLQLRLRAKIKCACSFYLTRWLWAVHTTRRSRIVWNNFEFFFVFKLKIEILKFLFLASQPLLSPLPSPVDGEQQHQQLRQQQQLQLRNPLQ